MPCKPTYEELEQKIKKLEKAESERKREVNALREQLLHQTTLMDASLDGIAIIDQTHRVRQANKRFAQMLGYTPEEVLDLHTWDWEANMTEAEVRANFKELSKTQTTFETRHRRKDGRTYDAEVTACGAKSGEESMVLTITRDITCRKQDEEALRESEERYRTFFEQGPDGVVVLEPETARIIEFNDRACRQLGYSREEFARLRVPDIEAKETAIETKTQIQKVLDEGYDDFETIQRTKQGETRHVHVTAQSIKIAGRSVYHCIWRDITDRKLAEEALRERDEKYRNLAENPFVGIFRTALDDGTFLYSNQKNAEIIGHASSKDLIGRLRAADFYPSEVRAELLDILRREKKVEDFETELVLEDGTRKNISINAQLWAEKGYLEGVIVDITERRRAEKAKLEAMARFYGFAEASQYGMGMADLDGHIVYANSTLARMFGEKSPENCLCKHFPTAYYSSSMTRKLLEEVMPALMRDGHWHGELALLTTDRRCVPTDENHFVIPDENGKPRYLAVILTDITERKQVEGALRESEEKYRILTEESADPIFSFTPDGRYTFVNRAFANGVGKLANDIIGKTLWDVFPRKEADKRFAALSQVFETGKEKVIEVRVPRPDGDQYYVTTITPVKNSEGHVDSVICSAKNITARKEMEEENEMNMRRFQALLKLNQMAEASLSEITDFTLEEAVSLTGSKIGYLAFLNDDESVLTMHAWSRSAMRECAITDKPILYPVSETGLWGEAVRQRKTIITNDYLSPNPFKKGTPAGHVALLRHMNTPIFDGDKIVIVAGVGNKEAVYTQADADQISLLMQGMWRLVERKRAEEERERLHKRLTQAQKMEAVGRLAGGVAHDFNNMLSVIIGYTDLTMAQAKPIKPIHTALKEIQKAAYRSADVTRQLLAFARKQTISPRVLDFNKILENMLKMLRRLIGEDIDLVWLPEPDLWPVKVDPSQLDQILVNLCVNARDAIAGVGKIIIETRNASFDPAYCEDHPDCVPGDYILLAVSDDGCGMDKQTLNKIFEPFFTTKDVDKGTGLGLATVYGIIKQNNGFINVYSEPNSGTTFKIYLPRHEIAATPRWNMAASVTDELGSETILLVEDELPILEMTAIMLERLGYTVLTAQRPGEAIQMAREHAGEIHLLMTDVVMPEMNGRDLARNLLSLYPNIKRLFMSGYTANVIAHHGILDEGVNFIQKPFSMENLGAKVRDALDGKKAPR